MLHRFSPIGVLAAVVLALAGGAGGSASAAGPAPDWCDAPSPDGDAACAGLELRYHTAGVSAATSAQWAGQWLFTDSAGVPRIGWCTYNRGLHPRADTPTQMVTQQLPNDPTGGKSAFLTWRYGTTSDDLTAAALWAVFHFYAQDPAGSSRAHDPESPLVPSLEMLSAASGRDDLQRLALALDDEARRHAAPFELAVRADDSSALALVMSGGVGVAGVPVVLGGVALITDAHGRATIAANPGDSVRALASVPGPAVVHLGEPLRPHPYGGQLLLAAGPPAELLGSVTLEAPPPTPPTTPPPLTTTAPPPTPTPTVPLPTLLPTTEPLPTLLPTTEPPTTAPTTTAVPRTVAETTIVETTLATLPTQLVEVAPTTTVPPQSTTSSSPTPVATVPPPGSPPPPTSVPPTLPATGGRTGDIAAAGAVVLGAGIGALVGLRRRPFDLDLADDGP